MTQEDTQGQINPPANEPTNGEVSQVEEVGPVDELAKVTAERDDYLDQLQRSRAEFINFRRRNEQERAALRQFVTRDVVAGFLPVFDDLERAIAAIPEAERESGWVKGVEMIRAKLGATFDRLGVTKLDALGAAFDPSIHEAVATQPGSSGSTVVEVYQPGYKIGEVLVRPAMVMTGDPAPQDEEVSATLNA